MRRFVWFKLLALAGVAILAMVACGCDGGRVVWRAEASPASAASVEGTR